MNDYSKEFFQKKGSAGGKKHNAKKTADTLKEKYGKNYYRELAKKRKKKQKINQ